MNKDSMSIVYVLKCKEDKYYVGKSDDFLSRIQAHKDGKAAAWTKTYPPVQCIEVLEGDKETEKATTLKYMRLYGVNNVRGYAWTGHHLFTKDCKSSRAFIKELQNGNQYSNHH